jgi:hypothetical protein
MMIETGRKAKLPKTLMKKSDRADAVDILQQAIRPDGGKADARGPTLRAIVISCIEKQVRRRRSVEISIQ